MVPISVMVLSDDRLFASALETVLSRQRDLRVIDAAAGEEAPDVVVIEAAWSRGHALQRTFAVKEMLPGAQVIVLGLEQEDDNVVDFIEAGAVAYVLRSAPSDDLFSTIRAVRRGEALSSPRVVASALERISRLAPRRVSAGPLDSLTEREREILCLLAAGLQNKEISKALRITLQTVKNHVHNILEKLGEHSRRKAVRRAFELGILRDEADWIDLF